MANYSEFIAPEYSVPTFIEIFSSASAFESYYSGISILSSEVNATFLNKLWYLIYAKYGNNPIVGEDITQWKYQLLVKINAYAPTYIKKEEIQAALRALDLDNLREGFATIMNHAINPSKAPSTDNTDELPYINAQDVNKGKRGKADAYAMLWDILRSNLLDDFLAKFAPLFSKVVSTSERIVFISEE